MEKDYILKKSKETNYGAFRMFGHRVSINQFDMDNYHGNTNTTSAYTGDEYKEIEDFYPETEM